MSYNLTDEETNFICNALKGLNEHLATEIPKIVYQNSKRISDHARTVQYKSQSIDVISTLAAEHSLVELAQIYKSNMTSDEASICARDFTTAYPPSIIKMYDDKNQIHFGYTWLELCRLHIEFLMRACNLDPIRAVEKQEAEEFWRRMKVDQKCVLNFPTIYGKPEGLRTAMLVQHKQVVDLLLLKETILPLLIEKSFDLSPN